MTLEEAKASKPGGADGWFLLFQRPKCVDERGSLPAGTGWWFWWQCHRARVACASFPPRHNLSRRSEAFRQGSAFRLLKHIRKTIELMSAVKIDYCCSMHAINFGLQ